MTYVLRVIIIFRIVKNACAIPEEHYNRNLVKKSACARYVFSFAYNFIDARI